MNPDGKRQGFFIEVTRAALTNRFSVNHFSSFSIDISISNETIQN